MKTGEGRQDSLRSIISAEAKRYAKRFGSKCPFCVNGLNKDDESICTLCNGTGYVIKKSCGNQALKRWNDRCRVHTKH